MASVGYGSLRFAAVGLPLIKTVVFFFTQIFEVQFSVSVSLCSLKQPETPSRVSRPYALRAFCRVRDECSANADTQSRLLRELRRVKRTEQRTCERLDSVGFS